MIRLFRFMLLLLSLVAAGAARAETHIRVSLLSESDRPAAGSTVMLAVAMQPTPGWHGYWRNPGDAGLENRAAWTLPAGASAGAFAYPVPGRLVLGGLMNHVYEKPYALLAPLRVPAGLAAGAPLPIRLKLDYLVCSDQLCVPEVAELALDLAIGDGAVDGARRARFDRWRAALPRPLGGRASFARAGDQLRLAIPLPAAMTVTDPWFFTETDGALAYAHPQKVTRSGDTLIVETKAGSGRPDRISGVFAIGNGVGLSLIAEPGEVPPAGAAIGEAAVDGKAGTIALALGGALLGGLLLNIMPCVFPILSLKALNLAKAGGDERQARREALAYTAGVVLVCVALGALLLGLRAGGAAVGWAFQLQDVRVIVVLLLLVVAIALNLAGLFELTTLGFGDRLAAGGGASGAFWTGALAAFVATPCTGPFMGAALGLALVLPAAAALAIFAGLGLGLALPFLLLGFSPALRARLPRPGAWMERFRRILSIPMFATALGLAWVLGHQAGVDGMTLGIAATLLVGLALWWVGRRQQRGGAASWLPLVPALAVALVIAGIVPRTTGPAEAATAGALAAEPFDPARLAALRAQQRPVFVYFTADWCLTCKVNERVAIGTATAQDAFRRKGVAVLVGDWTDGDPVLGRFIEAHNRAGVPLYLYYPPGAAAPRVLPQVLTPGMLAAL